MVKNLLDRAEEAITLADKDTPKQSPSEIFESLDEFGRILVLVLLATGALAITALVVMR